MMLRSGGPRSAELRLTPSRWSIAAVLVASVVGWLLVVASLTRFVSLIRGIGWLDALSLAVLMMLPLVAISTTRQFLASRRVRAGLSPDVLEQRCHGNLAAITDSERRPLRSIGTTARSVAEATGSLISGLTEIPSVRIFRGLASGDLKAPVALAVSGGRALILVEPVAWPAGYYQVGSDGGVSCDGTFIGQSVAPLADAVRYWRRRLPRSHRVSALVIVHPTDGGRYRLPGPTPEIAFGLVDSAVEDLGRRMSGGRQTISGPMLAALVEATS
jgi:hypothetical protein